MNRFRVYTETCEDNLVYVLSDSRSEAIARLVPGLGANCLELRLLTDAGSDAVPVQLIDDMQFIGRLHEAPSRYGIPVLFPWPSSIPNGNFQFDGNMFRLNDPGSEGSRYHGFVQDAPWVVVDYDSDNDGAWITCAVDSSSCGEWSSRFPSSCRLEVTWRLGVDAFQIQMKASNTGNAVMPMGIGLHPYFKLPLGPLGIGNDCRIRADVGRQWDLAVSMVVEPGALKPDHLLLPEFTFDPTPPEGTALSEISLNHVYKATFDEQDITRASVIDPSSHLKLSVSASRDFGTWVFYTPSDRSAISLEPWTLTPNGFNLMAAGVEGTGTLVLGPGEIWNGMVKIHCEQV